MPKPTLQTLLFSLTLVAGMSLSACNKDASSNPVDEQVTPTTETPAEQTPPATPASTDESDMDGATAIEGTPIKYDVTEWQTSEVTPVMLNDLPAIQAALGTVASTDNNSLDYASNPATKYRFMSEDEPYLDIIDSERYLELGWYYANPTDNDKEKATSQDHAKRGYTLARQLMGDEGGQLVNDMLNGQITKNKTIGGQQVELAKCEFYSCMLIFKKSES